MAIDEIVDRPTQLPECASLAAPARVLEVPLERRVTVSVVLALCFVEIGWLGALVAGVLWLFGAA